MTGVIRSPISVQGNGAAVPGHSQVWLEGRNKVGLAGALEAKRDLGQAMVAHAFNPSRSICLQSEFPGHPGVRREILSQKTKGGKWKRDLGLTLYLG